MLPPRIADHLDRQRTPRLGAQSCLEALRPAVHIASRSLRSAIPKSSVAASLTLRSCGRKNPCPCGDAGARQHLITCWSITL
jgi:hypothetical protein